MTTSHNTNQSRKNPSEQVHFIIDKFRMGWSVGKITDALVFKLGEAARGTPTVHSITSRFNANYIQWYRQASSTKEIKVIMSVLPEVLRFSKGQKQEFTQVEANWVARVGRACPTLPLYYVWVIAASRVIVEIANAARDAALDEKDKRGIRKLNSLNAELIHELKTQCFYPMDKDHASWDIVYTNPQLVPDDSKMDQSSMDDLVNWVYAQESGQAKLEKILQQEDEISGGNTN